MLPPQLPFTSRLRAGVLVPIPTTPFTIKSPVPVFTTTLVAPVVFPIVIVFALAFVPIFIAPVVPESSVRVFAPVDESAPAPAKVIAVAEYAMVSIEAMPVKAPLEVRFRPLEVIVSESSADPIVRVSIVVLSVPIFMAFPPIPVPMLIVLELFPVPKFTVPVVPESTVTEPVVPDFIDTLPVVAVNRVIPPVPELRARPVAPVALPTVTVLAEASVPIFIAPVPVFKLNVPFVVV